MKLWLYKRLFSILSFLSDKTNGAALPIKYKLIIGTLIIGLTNTACTSRNPDINILCYDPIYIPPIDSIENDSTSNKISKDTIEECNSMVTCYDIAIPEQYNNDEQ